MATAAARPVDLHHPEVIVDFTCRDGILYVVLKNIGARSAYRVTTRFDKPFSGLGGRKPIAELREVAIESIELVHEGIRLESAG